MSSATLITDGTPEAAALVHFLRGKVSGLHRVDALSPSDVKKVAKARRREATRERLVLVAEEPAASGDLDAGPALHAVRSWLEGLDPFEARAAGASKIEEALRAERPGASEVLTLLRRISSTKTEAPAPKKRGRPKGERAPFRGAGFDVCVALLREPARSFSERALAEAAGRSYYGVHRVLVELDARGYLTREEAGGTTLARREALRDDVVADFRSRVFGSARGAVHFAPPPRREVAEATFEALRTGGFEPVLAGASALPPGEGIAGGPLTLYAPREAHDALLHAGFRALRSGGGGLVVWPIVEKALVAHPVYRDGVARTHPVITYLDLVASGDERERQIAEESWGR